MNDNIYPRLLYYLHQNNYEPDEYVHEKINILQTGNSFFIEKFNFPNIAKPTISLLLAFNNDDVEKYMKSYQKAMLKKRFEKSEFYDCIVELISESKNK